MSLAPERAKRVLVTGGAGYIGSHAVLALLDAGHHVVVLDNLCTGFRSAVDTRATFVVGDVGDSAVLRSLLTDTRIDAVMHFAGSVVVPESVLDPLKYYRNNTAASLALIGCCADYGVRHIIFSSTAAVYGAAQKTRVTEDDVLQPVSPYGWSKLMTEQMLRDVRASGALNFGILRYFNVAGADPAGRAGQSTKGATHLVKTAVEVAHGRRPSLSVFGSDYETKDGTGVRDYIHVSDLAQAHLRALLWLTEQPTMSLTLNCGYGRGYSVLDIVAAVERVSGTKIDVVHAPRRSGDVSELVADNRRILAQLDWEPQHDSIDQIVADALRWEARAR